MKKFLICLALGVAGVSTILGQHTPSRIPFNGGHRRPPAGGTWTQVIAPPPFSFANQTWLLTDGSVLVMEVDGDGHMFKLTPDINGNYVTGTWSQVASMNTLRQYFGSGVLADGRVIVCGGEYGGPNYNNGNANWINNCEIFDPVANTWTNLSPPPGWGNIGDAPSMVLPNGQFLLGHDFDSQTALYNPTTNTWSLTGNGHAGSFDEDSWTLLPNNCVLDIECQSAPNSQYYDVATGSWVSIGAVPGNLADPYAETGADVLLPNGTVFAIGARASTDLYNVATNSWTAGPTLPSFGGSQLCQADAPAIVLPSGNVLMALSPYSPNNYPTPTYMYEYDGSTISAVNDPIAGPFIPSFAAVFLMLPNGQVLMTSQSNVVEIYTPAGSYQPAWQPTITSVSGTLNAGGANYSLSGTQLNGVTLGACYGDDSQNYTNYPLVRIQNVATGHVFYCRTHDHSTMGVQTGSTIVSTKFDVPAGVETGPSNLYVVANGIPSAPQAVNVLAAHVYVPTAYSLYRGVYSSGSLSSLFYSDSNVLAALTGPTLNTFEAPVQYVITGASPTLTPTSLKFTVTAKVNTPGTSQTISLWNYSTSAYDVLDTRAMLITNSTVTVTATGTLSNYVSASGAVQARVAYKQTSPTLIFRWLTSIDLANWTIQ